MRHSFHLGAFQIDRLVFLWTMFSLILPSFCPTPSPFSLPSTAPCFLSPIQFSTLKSLHLPLFCLLLNFYYLSYSTLFPHLHTTSCSVFTLSSDLITSHLHPPLSPTFISITFQLPLSPPPVSSRPFLIRTMIRPKTRFWNTKLALASSNAPLWRRHPPLLLSPTSGRNASPPLLRPHAFSSNKWYVWMDVCLDKTRGFQLFFHNFPD